MRPALPPLPVVKAPPPPTRSEPPPDDLDDDEAPTAMFVHPVKYTYDPNGPPGSTRPPEDDDDDDENDPPTAIHVNPYRSENTAGAGSPSDAGPMRQRLMPPIPAAGMPAAQFPQRLGASAPMASAPVRQPPAAPAQPPPAQPPPAHGGETASAPARERLVSTQQIYLRAASGPTRLISGYPQVGDPEAAPVWLKAVAVSSVVSALTVLAVLGWMIQQRF